MGNFIKVSDKYAVASDSLQWMVKKSFKRKDKETGVVSIVWRPILFFSDLSRCVKGLGSLMLRETDTNNYTDLVKAASDISDLLNVTFTEEVIINHANE